jgi:hypothetical protein
MTVRPLAKFCLAAFACFSTVVNAAAEEHKRVMILHSVGREFRPWNDMQRTCVRSSIASRLGR